MIRALTPMILLALFSAGGSGTATHRGAPIVAQHTIMMKDQKFSLAKVTIKAGDVVDFKNEDPFSHNVFSLSDIAVFDLGSYPKGQSRWHTFYNPGKGVIECALHPDMRMEIEVLP